MQNSPFTRIITVVATTAKIAAELFGSNVNGVVEAYSVRASASDNLTLDAYLTDKIVASGQVAAPSAVPASEFRVLAAIGGVPAVSATESFMGSSLAVPMPFEGGLWVQLTPAGGAGGTYVISVRGHVLR